MDEDEELQKAIMMSMGVGNKDELPADFRNLDMNQSFYKDIQMQDAYMDQIKKNNKKWSNHL